MTTRKRETKKSQPAPESLEMLAAHISAVMNHPLVPVDLYDALGDVMTEKSNRINMNTPDYIQRALEAAAEHERKSKETA
jgi:hypothetical protein